MARPGSGSAGERPWPPRPGSAWRVRIRALAVSRWRIRWWFTDLLDPARARHPIADAKGTSAIEFALVAPILVLMLLGSVDASRAVTAANRAGYVADSIAELVSQVDHVLTADEIEGFIRSAPLIDADILDYGRQIGSTDLASLVNVTVSSIAFTKAVPTCTANCIFLATTIFSRALSGTTRPCGLLLPAADGAPAASKTLPISTFGPVSLVVVDVEVFFKPLFLSAMAFPAKFRRSAYFRPRQVTQVRAASNCPGV
ncbi:TadE/TadG family type IV pilus assembly protein [Methylobacterium segetis]|uniref:TadE/TadG family type IV pilus assembly protein n=1 Tax=Methylobacterium segetis TaxID=2488750 RepID=UPI001046F46E|nr:TadE/TadG family type IV pilus assembly protein [Methylobacterium segetis]